MKRYIAVHMHDYQPPRESPYTGRIERQPSAAPFHNWNARIDRECYATNGRARIIDGGGNVIGVVNNYEFVSFNIGPTLLTWMADFAPDTLNAVIEGDRLSAARLNGHGNAIAQVYNHQIMPLAHDRDKKTQVVWGVKSFECFFHRKPEGMHLAETAVDVETLEALAAEGIKFTILAPRQAKRWRKKGETTWSEGGVDPSQAYQVNLPSGRTIAVFFYDGPVSQAVAFEKLLESGDKFLGRLMSGFNDSRQHTQLMHIAVDGETFGHHHKHGEMCMAWVVNELKKRQDVELTSYGHYLELNPPTMEAEVWDNSSWSCSHGVERWRSNCGCNSGANGKWHQQWRKPLRDGLNHLRAQLDSLFDREGRKLFADPWAARNDYIDVLLDGSTAAAWFRRHAKAETLKLAGGAGKDLIGSETFQKAVSLMEMSRFGMLMFTSCAWFFDDVAGLEPVQNLRYAARAIELATQFDQDDLVDLEARFVAELEGAQCNLPAFGNGKGVWEQLVKPQAVAGQLQYMFHGPLNRGKDVEHLDALIREASKLGITFDAWAAQNKLLDAYAGAVEAGKLTDELKAAFEKLAVTLKVDKSVLGWRDGACAQARVDVAFKLPRVMRRRPGRRNCWHRETGKVCK